MTTPSWSGAHPPFWQTMYREIVATLAEVGSDAKPSDYLNFYCLGNRETEEGTQVGGCMDVYVHLVEA